MKTFLRCQHAVMIVVAIGFAPVAASGATLHVGTGGPPTELNIDSYPAFHTTDADVTGAQLIELTNPTFLIALWSESISGGEPVPYYSFGDDGGSMTRAWQTSYVLKLVYEDFDPLNGVPAVPASLTADPADELYIVQFLTQPLPRFREDIEGLGGTVRTTLPNNARIVEMDDTAKASVAALPYVRWIGEFHPAYRVEGYVRDGIAGGTLPSHRYNIKVFERGLTQKTIVADRITALGGTVEVVPAAGFLLQATLTPDQVESVTHWDEVAFLDRWGDLDVFMNQARIIGGADYLEAAGPFTGEDVKGEIMDVGFDTSHVAFARCVGDEDDGVACLDDSDCCGGGVCTQYAIPHGVQEGPGSHGTSVFGVVFDSGAGAPPAPQGQEGVIKGLLPSGQGYFAAAYQLEERAVPELPGEGHGLSREAHTCQLVAEDAAACLACCETSCGASAGCSQECCDAGTCDEESCDPACCECFYGHCPYEAVFQTNSWGTNTPGLPGEPPESRYRYATESSKLDDILFDYDIVTCQAQGHPAGVPHPMAWEAWAKNVVTVGGVKHDDDRNPTEHDWQDNVCTTGPAPDGRIKPDFAHFADDVFAPCVDMNGPALPNCDAGDYKTNFGGTSAATPIVCGHFGLLSEMWHEGEFNVCDAVDDCVGHNMSGGSTSVFASRPRATTAKALMINTSNPYVFYGDLPPNPALTRERQGWGLPSVQKLYTLALGDNFRRIVDGTRVLDFTDPANDSQEYNVTVESGTEVLKVTLVYADPGGPESSIVNAVFDLDLKVTEPDGTTVYWGNCGLWGSNWSSASCGGPNPPNTIDPVTNVIDTVENVFVRNPTAGDWSIEVIAANAVADYSLVVSVDPDCQSPQNNIPDSVDISIGESFDCNLNGVPDECDIDTGTSADVNANGVPDECDECVVDADCDDGLGYTGVETCQIDVCVPGVSPCIPGTACPELDEFFNDFRTYDEYKKFLDVLAAWAPTGVAAEVSSMGQSFEGRDLWVIRITGPGTDKPGVLYHGGQHGAEYEWPGASTVAYAAHYLLANYTSDSDVQDLVDDVEWFLMPIMNPDGFVFSWADDSSGHDGRKNRNDADWCELTQLGVNLNRNWGYYWGEGDPVGPNDPSYPGASAFSETETQAVRDFLQEELNIRGYIDLHAYAKTIMWPWSFLSGSPPHVRTFESVGQEMHDLIFDEGNGPDYEAGQVHQWSPYSGPAVDWVYGVANRWAYAIEVDRALLSQPSKILEIAEDNLPALLYFGEWIGCAYSEDPESAQFADCNNNAVPDGCESDADCDNNGTQDICDIGECSPSHPDYPGCEDCNSNGIPDSCDIGGVSADGNGNGVPDECDGLNAPAAASGVHAARKNRYISIDPVTNGSTAVALKVTLKSMKRCDDFPDYDEACETDDDCDGLCIEHPHVGATWWVAAPEDVDGEYISRVVTAPVYRLWSEEVVQVGDCEIVPVATYEVRACLPPHGTVCSGPITIGTIEKPIVHYGDVVGTGTGELPPEPGFTPPNGVVNVTDVQAFILTRQGPSVPSAPTTWVDLQGECEGTPPNGGLNVSDLQRILFGQKGLTYTATPEQRNPGDCPNPPDCPDLMGTPTLFTLDSSADIIDPGEPVEVEVYLDSVGDLGAIELALEVSGGTSGELLLTGITIDSQRQDYVFESQPAHNAKNLTKGSLSNVLESGSVQVTGGGYLATFTYQPSGGASGVFTLSVKEDGASFLNDGDGVRLATSPDSAQVIGVGIDCFDDLDCDDSNECTTDTCSNYECSYGNVSQGTSCDDGMFCTLTDECDGNGTCTGSGTPCTIFQICLEASDRCVYPPPP